MQDKKNRFTMKNKKQERKSQYRFTAEERQIHFTMKYMKGVKENLGTPLSVAAFLISPFRRPTPRRWITPGEPPVASKGNNFCLQGKP